MTNEEKADMAIDSVRIWIKSVMMDIPAKDNEESLNLWDSIYQRLDAVQNILCALKSDATQEEVARAEYGMQSLTELAGRMAAMNVIEKARNAN